MKMNNHDNILIQIYYRGAVKTIRDGCKAYTVPSKPFLLRFCWLRYIKWHDTEKEIAFSTTGGKIGTQSTSKIYRKRTGKKSIYFSPNRIQKGQSAPAHCGQSCMATAPESGIGATSPRDKNKIRRSNIYGAPIFPIERESLLVQYQQD